MSTAASAFAKTGEASAKVDPHDLPAGTRTYLKQWWVGQVDLRPFAAWRLAIGLFLFYDLCDLFPNIRTFFSDEGVLPRAAFLGQWARQWRFSVLDTAGTPTFAYIIWFMAAAAVLCMAFGYRSRIAAVAAFIFMASFQERIPPLFDGSDTVIRMILFWNMFCPSGNVWSVDALLAEKRGNPLPKTARALPFRLLQLQIALIYLITFFHKIQGRTWRIGEAVHYCLHLDYVFSRPWAVMIADNRLLMGLATYGTLVFECAFLPLVFLPIKSEKISKGVKAFAIASIVSMHIGIMFTINVGLFSYLMPLCLLVFWEPEWIQKLMNSIEAFLGKSRMDRIREIALAFPEPRGWERPPSTWFSDATKKKMSGALSWALVVWFGFCTWYATPPYMQTWVAQQLTRITGTPMTGKPKWIEEPVQALDVWSSWDMFSPEPLRTDYHLTAPGELEDGTPVNLFDSPDGEHRGFWFTRWYKYFENVTGGDQLLPLEWGRYMCREHNFYLQPGQKRLYTFTLYKDNQIIPPIGQPWPPVTRQTVWVHRCFDKPNTAPSKTVQPAVAASPAMKP